MHLTNDTERGKGGESVLALPQSLFACIDLLASQRKVDSLAKPSKKCHSWQTGRSSVSALRQRLAKKKEGSYPSLCEQLSTKFTIPQTARFVLESKRDQGRHSAFRHLFVPRRLAINLYFTLLPLCCQHKLSASLLLFFPSAFVHHHLYLAGLSTIFHP